MILEKLKDVLDEETFAEVEEAINAAFEQRDAAKNEAISKRRSIKAENTALRSQLADVLERLGVDSYEDLTDEQIGKAKDSGKQSDAEIRRLSKQLEEANKRAEAKDQENRTLKRGQAISKALSGHDFIDPEVVESYISQNLVWEDDEILYKQADGNLISVSDGVSSFAKSRPALLKASGSGGAGVKSSNARGSAGPETMTRAEFDALPPEKRVELSKSGITLQ